MKTAKTVLMLLCLLAAVPFAGCDSPSKSVAISDEDLPYADIEIHEPDFVIVEDFGVTPDEIALMGGFSNEIGRAFSSQTLTEEEIKVGRTLAKVLREQLVLEMNRLGITTYSPDEAPRMTFKTGVVKGFFYEADQGDRTLRNLLGFGLGQSSISMRVLFNEREVTIASVTVTTETEMKPGLLPGVAAIEEALVGTVENDARRAAKKIAEELYASYQKRGWRD